MAESKTVPQKEPSEQNRAETTPSGVSFTPRVDISETDQELTLFADVPGVRVNVWEDAGHVFVEAELPGLDLKDLEIYVTGGNQLALKGERKPTLPEQGIAHRQERGFGSFVRTLTLPFDVDPDKVEARFENGVLLIKLAKHAPAKPRKITVKSE